MTLTNPVTGETRERKALLSVWSTGLACAAVGAAAISSELATPGPEQSSSTATVALASKPPKVEVRDPAWDLGWQHDEPTASRSYSESLPQSPNREALAAAANEEADISALSLMKRPTRAGEEYAVLSYQGIQALRLVWDTANRRVFTRFTPVQII